MMNKFFLAVGALLLSTLGAAAQPAPGSFPGCVYNSTPPSLADKQTTALQCDSSGRIKTTGGGAIAFPVTVSGTVNSGGIPYFNSTTQMSSSAALAAGQVVIGGGAGAAPSTSGIGALATSLAIGGATIGSNALAVTGTSLLNNRLTITQATANQSILASTGYSLTGSNAQSMVDLAGTWNTSGTPTAIKLNITKTSVNSAALLQDWQVGGVSLVNIRQDGRLLTTGGIFETSANGVQVLNNSGVFVLGASQDVFITRDGADTSAQRRGTNAQQHNWYYSYTDASNRQYGALRTGASYVEVAALTAGTGADNLDVRLTPAGTGGVDVGANYQSLTEMAVPAAPAANGARIFAQDNGAGKTQMCALFATGAVQCFATEP